jgi:predicted nucleic acid-binding protein
MIFIDSHVPMYLVGAAHPLKDRARQALEQAIEADERLVTSAEVFQEILHRYVAIGRRDAIQPAWDVLAGVVDAVFSIGRVDVDRARELVLGYAHLSARDALHAAVMEREQVKRILTFDTGFDQLPGVTRIGDS